MSLHPAVPLHEENTRACWSCSHAQPRSPTRDLPAAQILSKLAAQKRLEAFLPKLHLHFYFTGSSGAPVIFWGGGTV